MLESIMEKLQERRGQAAKIPVAENTPALSSCGGRIGACWWGGGGSKTSGSGQMVPTGRHGSRKAGGGMEAADLHGEVQRCHNIREEGRASLGAQMSVHQKRVCVCVCSLHLY